MNNLKLGKYIFAVVMIILLVFNIYALFFYENSAADENEELTTQNKELKKQVKEYKDKQKNISNTAREQHYEDLTSKADQFMELIFTQKPEGYQERKDAAKDFFSDDLMKKYFSPDEYTNDDMTSEVDDKQLFIEEMDKRQEKAHVIAKVRHKEINNIKDKTNKREVYTRITFERDGENWEATSSKNIFTDDIKDD